MSSNTILLEDIEAFLDATGMAEGKFGQLAVGNRHLIKRLRSGGGVTLNSADRIDAFMDRYKMPNEKKSDVVEEFL